MSSPITYPKLLLHCGSELEVLTCHEGRMQGILASISVRMMNMSYKFYTASTSGDTSLHTHLGRHESCDLSTIGQTLHGTTEEENIPHQNR